jgi:outer membrane protein OmpA-like peptidoglycan-associated protein
MSDDKMPTDWASDVKRYVPDADDGVIAAIVRYCGIALRTRDASLVSFDDPVETDRVRENFCKKKLGLTDPDEVLDGAIAKVGERMSDTTFRNRVTVYYLLAEHFGKLGLFGAAAAATASVAAVAAPVADVTPVAPLAAAPLAAAIPVGAHQARRDNGDGGFFGLAGLVFVGASAIMLFAAITGSYVAGRFDAEPATPPAPVVAPAPEPVAPAIPEGAGIVSEVVEGRPKVSVYFDVGKSDIAPDFAAAVAPVRAWLEANPDDRVQLSGFTDPTGNAAANAELAKDRAEAVAAQLTSEGVAADRIDLVKPEDSSDETVELSAARRVEITVTGS